MARNRIFTGITLWFAIRVDHMIAWFKGLAKPCMSIHRMASPTACLVSIEVNYLTVTSDCSCLVTNYIYRFVAGMCFSFLYSSSSPDFCEDHSYSWKAFIYFSVFLLASLAWLFRQNHLSHGQLIQEKYHQLPQWKPVSGQFAPWNHLWTITKSTKLVTLHKISNGQPLIIIPCFLLNHSQLTPQSL